MQQPNFLFFITDQQRYDHVGYAGNKIVRTPNIDGLAQRGAWLPKFYVASPTCMSSRATLMTGRMPSLNGVKYNGIPLDLDSVTFVDLLRAEGYKTALIGKSHIQGMLEAKSMAPGRDFGDFKPPPAELAEAKRTSYSKDDYATEMMEVWARDASHAEKIKLPYYGFDHVEFCLGHGDTVTGHYGAWLAEHGLAPDGAGLNHARKISDVSAPQVYQPAVDEGGYPTHYVKERTIEYLKRHAGTQGAEPFFIQCSFPDPHHPFCPPGKYYDMYDPADIDLPQSFLQPNKDAIPPVKYLWDEYESGAEHKRWTFPFVTGEKETRDILAKQYGQITMIDDAIGDVLAALNELGMAENTVICFLSDHGDYLGDHGLMLKGPMHYQSVIRVPFIWCDPDQQYQTGRVDSLGSVLDVAQTVLHRAGLQPYNGIQGNSMLSMFSGQVTDRQVLVETTTQYPYLVFDDLVSVTTLVDSEWRLSIWQGCDWGELYNLKDDPWELVNLWDDESHSRVRGRLMHDLIKLMQDHQETSPYPLSVS